MKSWTFETKEIADSFDSHVREQLPWYDMVTDAVCYITRNYLTEGGVVVDIGASTGNMIDKLMPLVEERWADVVAIEKSQSMCTILRKKYKQSDYVVIENNDVINHELPNADVLIVFLTMMVFQVNAPKGRD